MTEQSKQTVNKIFMIAGEPSGDVLGGHMMAALKKASGGPVAFEGVGGDHMRVQGLKSLLPMNEICVMGIWEVVWQIPRLIKLINGMVEEIEKRQPDVLVTIDLPDFNFEVGKRLKARGIFKGRHIHYVAPSVWAWRPGRAEKIASFLDGLICLYPFEPPFFTKHNLETFYAGHPMVETDIDKASAERFRSEYDIPDGVPTLGVFFGSRIGEFERMSGTLTETVKAIKEIYPDLHLIIPTLPHLEYEILQIVSHIECPAFVVTDPAMKWDAFKAADVAVAVSGTVGLELAYAGVPHVIAYKAHVVTWLAIKSLVKVKYAHLANLLLDAPVVPEFLQFQCSPLLISGALLKLFKIPALREKQKEKFMALRALMGAGQEKLPSERAAAFVLQSLSGKRRVKKPAGQGKDPAKAAGGASKS